MRNLVSLALIIVAVHALADDSSKTVLASDEKTEIVVPNSWSPLDLNDAAEIQVGNEAEDAYLIVLNEAKDDLFAWNLERHSRVTLGQLLMNVANPTVIGPTALTIAGSPAVQYEIRGAAENRNLVYIHTTVDGPKHFSQIIAWTVPSKADRALPQLRRTILTFRELP
ncbi:MAG TPA: hypothetical protein VMS12_05565 [Thermoanaerobaculia bacterium]|nr:hypothetical protein [Thermoanaerobaculia bacterium]